MNDETAAPENPYANSTFDDTENVSFFAVAGVLALTFGVVFALLFLGFIGFLLLSAAQVLPNWSAALIGLIYGLAAILLPIIGARSMLIWLKTQ